MKKSGESVKHTIPAVGQPEINVFSSMFLFSRSSIKSVVSAVLCFLVLSFCISARAQTIQNAGFENNLTDWTPKADYSMSSASPEAARTGALGLRVTDERPDKGSWLESLAVEVEAGKTYELSLWMKTVSGEGKIEFSTQFFDEAGKRLLKKSPSLAAAPSAEWKQYTLSVKAPEGAVGFIVIIHSTASGVTTANLDDFEVKEVP